MEQKYGRAGLIPKRMVHELMADSNTGYCEELINIAGKRCNDFDTCTECIAYAMGWFFEGVE